MSKLGSALYLLFYTPYLIVRRIWMQLVALAIMFGFGTVVFMYFQHLDFLTALLGSVSTITTIGLYAPNLVTIPPLEKILLIVIFIVSVGLAASIVQSTVSAAVRKEILAEEASKLKAKTMKGHVIVGGYKFLGKYVVDYLRELGLDFVVLVRDQTQLDALRKDNIPALGAPITHTYEVLREASVEKASTIITTFDDDGDNLLMILNAKKLNPNIRVVSIVNDKELVEGAKTAGADVVVVPSELIGNVLALSAISDEVEGVFLNNSLGFRHIASFNVERDGVDYKDLKGICPILFVKRGDEIIYDLEGKTLKKGDVVYVLTDHNSLEAFREKIGLINAKSVDYKA
ncbi:MAG: potassium channel family protein [Thermoprotei archaeon]